MGARIINKQNCNNWVAVLDGYYLIIRKNCDLIQFMVTWDKVSVRDGWKVSVRDGKLLHFLSEFSFLVANLFSWSIMYIVRYVMKVFSYIYLNKQNRDFQFCPSMSNPLSPRCPSVTVIKLDVVFKWLVIFFKLFVPNVEWLM